MIRYSKVLVGLLFILSCCSPKLSPQESYILHAPWRVESVDRGVVWKYYHFDTLFNSKQSVTVFEIDLRTVDARVEYVDSGFFRTSARAHAVGAIAAVNGSFFNTKTGGSVVFLQHGGRVVTPPDDALRAYRDNAGFAIDHSGGLSIIRKPETGWKLMDRYSTILSSGPMLLYGGDTIAQVREKFNTNRHPRTAVGITGDNRLIAVVADGRSAQAYGMTIAELAAVMKALGCTVAMNLDGGGSSTAWIRGAGVINFPSDNKKFDHEGERAVANCIVFLPK